MAESFPERYSKLSGEQTLRISEGADGKIKISTHTRKPGSVSRTYVVAGGPYGQLEYPSGRTDLLRKHLKKYHTKEEVDSVVKAAKEHAKEHSGRKAATSPRRRSSRSRSRSASPGRKAVSPGRRAVSPRKTKKAPGEKKTQSPFFKYLSERRETLKRQHPEAKNTEISTLASAEWKKLTDEQKARYSDLPAKFRGLGAGEGILITGLIRDGTGYKVLGENKAIKAVETDRIKLLPGYRNVFYEPAKRDARDLVKLFQLIVA